MKILYGIQGTGNGHISRGRMMASCFNRHDADVTYLFSGRPPEKYFDMEIFGDFTRYRGITFCSKSGKIDYAATLNKLGMPDFIRDVIKLDLEAYDLVISDFEPITAWAAKLRGKKIIGLGHQYAFGPATPKSGYSPLATFIMRYFAPADIRIGLHWSAYDKNILPPIIDTSLIRNPAETPFILVYLPFEHQATVTQLLNRFPDIQFIQYSSELEDGQQDNVALRKTCLAHFKQDLRSARAVLSNSGFTLLSESIHLGLPLLVKPVKGQFEQQSNALALSQLGYGKITHELNYNVLKSWLKNLNDNTAHPFPDVAEAITRWILSGKHDIDLLSSELWQPMH